MTSPSAGTYFQHTSRLEEGGHIHYRVAKCADCGRAEMWRDKTRNGAPDEMIAAGLRKKGWKMDPKNRGSCPKCLGVAKKPLTPAQKRAVYLKLTDLETTAATAAPKPYLNLHVEQPVVETATGEPDMVEAAAPRTPTREDRRRVQDELDALYNVDLQRFKASWTDEAVAAKLSVPRAWVTEERDRAYGPAGNDTDVVRLAELQKLVTDLTAAGAEAMKAAEAALAASDRVDKLMVEFNAKRQAVA